MKTVSALEVRAHFGRLLDEAAAGERIVIERAGQPRAALVPLDDLRALDPDDRLAEQRAALDEIRRMARLRPFPSGFDAVSVVRDLREKRAGRVVAAVDEPGG